MVASLTKGVKLEPQLKTFSAVAAQRASGKNAPGCVIWQIPSKERGPETPENRGIRRYRAEKMMSARKILDKEKGEVVFEKPIVVVLY